MLEKSLILAILAKKPDQDLITAKLNELAQTPDSDIYADEHGISALAAASWKGNIPALQRLLQIADSLNLEPIEWNCFLTARTNRGDTSLSLAVRSNCTTCIALIMHAAKEKLPGDYYDIFVNTKVDLATVLKIAKSQPELNILASVAEDIDFDSESSSTEYSHAPDLDSDISDEPNDIPKKTKSWGSRMLKRLSSREQNSLLKE